MAELAFIYRGYEWYEERREGYANGIDYPSEELNETRLATSTQSWWSLSTRRERHFKRLKFAQYLEELKNTGTVEQKLDLLIRITIDGLS